MLSLLRIDRVDASTYNQIKKSHYNKYFIDLACSPATAASRNDALFWRKFYFKGGRVFHRKPCKSCKLAIPWGPPPSRSFAHMRSKTCCSTARLRVVGHAEKCIRLSPRKLKCCMTELFCWSSNLGYTEQRASSNRPYSQPLGLQGCTCNLPSPCWRILFPFLYFQHGWLLAFRLSCWDLLWYMGYWPSVRSRWVDIGEVLFLRVYGPRRTSLVNKAFIIWHKTPKHDKFYLRNKARIPLG